MDLFCITQSWHALGYANWHKVLEKKGQGEDVGNIMHCFTYCDWEKYWILKSESFIFGGGFGCCDCAAWAQWEQVKILLEGRKSAYVQENIFSGLILTLQVASQHQIDI